MFGTDAVTTGASNDIERATQIARNMITRWGFSKRLPPMQYEKDNESNAYLGGSSTSMISMSQETAKIIDEEVAEIINSCYKKAQDLLESHKDVLENMKDALLKYETIDADQIDDLMNHKEVRPPKKASDDKSKDNSSDDKNKTSDNKETTASAVESNSSDVKNSDVSADKIEADKTVETSSKDTSTDNAALDKSDENK